MIVNFVLVTSSQKQVHLTFGVAGYNKVKDSMSRRSYPKDIPCCWLRGSFGLFFVTWARMEHFRRDGKKPLRFNHLIRSQSYENKNLFLSQDRVFQLSLMLEL